MFIAGLETDIDEFKRSGKASVFVGLAGIAAPLAMGYLAGAAMQLSVFESLFIGLLLSATSVSISVQTLKELGRLKSREGAAVLGAAVIDDVVVVVLLAFALSLSAGDVSLGSVLLKKALFFAVVLLLSWKVVPWLLKRFAPMRVTESVVSAGLIICLLFAAFAEYTGVAAMIGAYIAGMAIGLTNYRQEVAEKTEAIGYSFFVPVFFASIGVSAQFSGVLDQLWLIVALCAVAIVSKWIGGALGAKAAGFGWRSSWGVGAAMISRGEVALIIAAIGRDSGLMSEEMFAVSVVVVLVTTLVTPPLLKVMFAEKVQGNTEKIVQSKAEGA
jgi:Kef-type K+ transport system membrane component KefB